MLRIEAAILGNLQEVVKEEQARAALAITDGTHIAADKLKSRLRAMVVQVFGSQRLANTWRGVSFPRRGKTSLGPTDLVYSKAPHIMAAFDATTVIRGKEGLYLAIPSPEAMKMRFANKRPTPQMVEERLGIRLRFVFRPGKSGLLVADQVRQRTGKRTGYLKASARAIKSGTAESVVMFFLVPQVTLKKRINLEAEYAQAETDMVNEIVAQWGRD